MSKEELKQLEDTLIEKGYTRYNNTIGHYKYYWAKSIRKYITDTDRNSDCMISYNIFDLSEYAHKDENLKNSPYSFEIELYLDESLDNCHYFRPTISTDMSVEQVEEMVDSLIEWAKTYNKTIKKL